MSKPRLRLIPTVLTLVAVTALLCVVIVGVRELRGSVLTPATVVALPIVDDGTLTGQVEATPSEPFSTPLDQAAPTLDPTPSATPTPLPTETPAPTATPAPAFTGPSPAVKLTGLRHAWQTWNNCGPATLSMYMSYYGNTLDQATIGAVLRRSPDDKNVSPDELVAYAQGQGYTARLLVNGNADMARTLLSNGFPMLVETWHESEPGFGLGHYRLLVGYDDAQQQWIAYDSLDASGLISLEPYGGIRMPYALLAEWWKVFNRTFLLVYPPEQEAQVAAILAQTYGDPAAMWQAAADQADAETRANPQDPFAWFNLGSSLVSLGRYADAAVAFDQARAIGWPERMLWYQFGPFEAYFNVGRAADVIALADEVLAEADSVEEVHYWRGRGLAALGDTAAARAALEQSLALNPDFVPAAQALAGLPPVSGG